MSDAAPGQAWARAAARWERRRALVASLGAPVTERLVALLQPRPGETILELACGTGEAGLAVAPHLEHGTLVQSDLVSEMVDAARREAARRGLPNVEHRELDAERLDLPDGSVDGVLCRWGYMLADDPVRALAETRRVLRPGGRVVLAVWAESARNPWATTIGRALLELGLIEPPDPGAPGPFRLGERARLLGAIAAAGLAVEADEEVPVTYRAPSPAEYWEATVDLSTSLGDRLAELSAMEIGAVRARTEQALAPFSGDDGVSLPGVSRVVLARARP